MTEQEAREKWCPFVRLGSVQDTNHAEGYCWNNRGEDTQPIAADCPPARISVSLIYPLSTVASGFVGCQEKRLALWRQYP